MLQSYVAAGERPPPELSELLDVINGAAPQGAEGPSEEIEPEPYFVVKARTLADGSKAFINMMGSPKIGAPGDWSNATMPDHVAEAMAKLEEGEENLTSATRRLCAFRSLSEPRVEKDKAGAPCSVRLRAQRRHHAGDHAAIARRAQAAWLRYRACAQLGGL